MYKFGVLTLALLVQQGSTAASAPTDSVANQLQLSDYKRALTIGDQYAKLTINVPDVPFWRADGESFVYRRTTKGKHQFILVNAATGTKQPVFDHTRLAAALNRASHKDYKADNLPFDRSSWPKMLAGSPSTSGIPGGAATL
nr:hypothetical protein [Bradyrhizobium sp. LMTR 3]